MKTLKIVLFTLIVTLYGFARGSFSGTGEVTLPEYRMSSFLDLHEDIETLKEQDKNLILFIHQQNCPYCAKFSKKILSDSTMKNKIKSHFGLVEFDMFGNRDVVTLSKEEMSEKEYAKLLNIQFTPTTLFFDHMGKIILRLNGYVNYDKFSKALDFIQSKKYQQLSFNQYLQNTKDKKESTLISEPFFKNNKNLARMKDAKKLAVFFESTHCSDCVTLHKTIQDKEIQGFIEKLDLVQIDVNSDRTIATPNRIIQNQKEWIKQLGITNTPTVVFFNELGEEIFRMDALFKLFHTQSIFDYVVSDVYKEQKEFQRYLTNRSNAIRDKGIDVDIWKD